MKEIELWRSRCGSVVMNLASIREDTGLIPDLAQWVMDLALLWLWHRPAAAAVIRPLAWEPSICCGCGPKKKKKKIKLYLKICKASRSLLTSSVVLYVCVHTENSCPDPDPEHLQHLRRLCHACSQLVLPTKVMTIPTSDTMA